VRTISDVTPSTPEPLRVACDGSSLGNPGPGGWAWYASDALHASGGAAHTTNNVMELTAVAEALRTLPDDAPLTLVCDSRYVIDACTKWIHGWKRNGWKTAAGKAVANQELVMQIDTLLRARRAPVRFEWVKAHVARGGDPLNEAADALARAAAEARR
jgi:ribonuclease HI